jgi:two-component system nitrogen regulation sensor histidine kinase NtrY
MRNLKILLGLLTLSIVALIVTGLVLSYIGVEHGPLLIKVGSIFLIVNIVLYLLILIFFVVRHLFIIYAEKKQKVLGSNFRTKLVAAFLGLTLVPSVLLFILSNQLINSSIDKWFSFEVQRPIEDSVDIAKMYYDGEKKKVQDYAALIASNKIRLDATATADSGKDNLKSYILKQPDGSDLVRDAFKGISGTDIISSDEGDTIRAAVSVNDSGRISGVVVVETLIPKVTVNKLETIIKMHNDYTQIKSQQNPVRFLYFLMLTVATMLIIFLALWVSLRIAKGITVPIRTLAEATKTVAHGDFNFRIDLQRDDEIGMLIASFNKMLDDLRDGKLSLEKAYTDSDQQRLSMEAILENINTGVISLERSGRIATINNAACSMLALDRIDILGKSHKELLEKIKSEELGLMVKKLEDKNFKFTEKEIHAYIGGRPVDLRVYITVLKDAKGNFIGILVVFDDLTEIITAQRALAWQEVAKRITHEIKNPLTPIKLSAERLMKKWEEKTDDFGEVLSRSAKTIIKEVDSLRGLVDEFSRFGKMPAINLEPYNIKSIIEEIIELYRGQKEIEIITSLRETPDIDIDKDQIKRALINLIDNAIQAKTMRIWLNTSYIPSLEIIRIEIIDEGVGIKEEDKDKLFYPYFSTKKEGTGLGLAIVNSIISKHRGYIRVRDNEPKGTQFIIELPAGAR